MGGQSSSDGPKPLRVCGRGGRTGPFTDGTGAHGCGDAVLVGRKAVRSRGRGVATLCLRVRSTGDRAKSLGQGLGDAQRPRYLATRTCLAQGSEVGVGADPKHESRTVQRTNPRPATFNRQHARRKEGRPEEGQERNQVVGFNGLVPVRIGVVGESRVRLGRGLVGQATRHEGKDGQCPKAVLPFHVPKDNTKPKKEGRPEGRPSEFNAQAQWEDYSITSNFFVVTKSFELTRTWYMPDS